MNLYNYIKHLCVLSKNRQSFAAGIFLALIFSGVVGCSDPEELPKITSTPGTTEPTPVPTDAPPIASFSSSCTDSVCNFDATASTDDLGITSYSWDFGDGSSGSGVTTSYTYPAADTSYTIILAVTDGSGATSSASQTIFVSSGNESPSASISTSCTARDCLFDGGGSTDDGSIVSYAWDFGDGRSSSGVTANHSYALDGDYTVMLTVTDNLAASSSSTQNLSISISGTNNPPLAAFSTVCTDLSCDFDAGASTDDGSIVSYSWDFGDGSNSSGATATASHLYTIDGSYTVVLTVEDDLGASSSSTQSVSVTSPNNPPSASFTFSCTDLACNFDASSSTDIDGDALTYGWDFGDSTNGSGITSSHSYSNAGSYSVLLTVTDDGGKSASSARSVTVSEPPPVIDGQAVYEAKCDSCHGTDAQGGSLGPDITVTGKDANLIKAAINTVTQMKRLSLTDAEIQAIAAYIATL